MNGAWRKGFRTATAPPDDVVCPHVAPAHRLHSHAAHQEVSLGDAVSQGAVWAGWRHAGPCLRPLERNLAAFLHSQLLHLHVVPHPHLPDVLFFNMLQHACDEPVTLYHLHCTDSP